MGAGIAQTAAVNGWTVRLTDVSEEAARRGAAGIEQNLKRLTERGKLAPDAAAEAQARIHVVAAPRELADAELFVEAIVEDLQTKIEVLGALTHLARPDALFASNTSSLSITRIGHGIGAARRTVGMHFFNPVPLMPLVEVIAGQHTDAPAADRTFEIARAWGKTPVRCRDTPGFIVNRVARGYYLESLRMLGEGVAGLDEIDRSLKSLAGFRMGPFELMDLIGIDVNYTVSCSVWEQMGRPERLRPHAIQQSLFESKQLGRKSGRGFYTHDGPAPLPAVTFERRSFDLSPRIYEAMRRVFDGATAGGAAADGSSTEQYVVARVLAALINEAHHALDEEVATRGDIDTAMTLGTNWPRGPIAWAEQIGRHTVAALLAALDGASGDGRFAAAKSLTA